MRGSWGRLGRSQAIQSMGIGRTIDVPVVVHNWSAKQQTGAVSLDLPPNFTVDANAKPYDLAPGADATVTFKLTNTDTTLPAQQNIRIPIRTATGSETLTLTLVPTSAIPQTTQAPVVDGKADPGEYPGPTLDLGRIWQGASACTGVDDCGVSSTGEGNTAKVSWSDDALYFFIHARDDYQSYAVTPEVHALRDHRRRDAAMVTEHERSPGEAGHAAGHPRRAALDDPVDRNPTAAAEGPRSPAHLLRDNQERGAGVRPQRGPVKSSPPPEERSWSVEPSIV
ncbi:hypothetical protein [Kribbella sindirgiensis]|uniref:hypothetical protein n=1 Tax=Kribbella sindirgiensis TaxID=1124744 RepID=UPI00192DE7B7|nr:hypothetical protein [Kribbella sindirgiensis]